MMLFGVLDLQKNWELEILRVDILIMILLSCKMDFWGSWLRVKGEEYPSKNLKRK